MKKITFAALWIIFLMFSDSTNCQGTEGFGMNLNQVNRNAIVVVQVDHSAGKALGYGTGFLIGTICPMTPFIL